MSLVAAKLLGGPHTSSDYGPRATGHMRLFVLANAALFLV